MPGPQWVNFRPYFPTFSGVFGTPQPVERPSDSLRIKLDSGLACWGCWPRGSKIVSEVN